MGGHRACTLIGERGWLMERIAAEPEVTVRGLMTELAERGVAVSYGTVWNFIHREGMSFKKKRAAGRARSPRRGAPPGAADGRGQGKARSRTAVGRRGEQLGQARPLGVPCLP
jgi:hypothetical protein